MFIRPHLTALTLAGVMLGATLTACAQTSQQPAPAPETQQAGRHGGGMMRKALESLNLSADQRSKIAGFTQQFRASRQTQTPETRQQYMQQIEGVLTPQQQADLKSNMKAMRKEAREQREAQPQPQPTAS